MSQGHAQEEYEQLPGLAEGVQSYLSLSPETDARSVKIYLTWVHLLEFHAEREQAGHGLRAAAFTIVRILFFEPERRRTLTDLAREMGVSITYITRLSVELEKLGLVERLRDESDRRLVFVHLTPAGEERCRKILMNNVRMIEASTSGLSGEEKDELQRLLLRFAVDYINSAGTHDKN